MSQMNQNDNPIAVFDSGVGGISVLRELIEIMPNENYLYYGDSKNAPYGTKELAEVRDLTLSHAKDLFERGAKALVVACNTATSAAVRLLRERYPQTPIVGIEPAVKPAVMCKKHPTVLVMATPMTIREEKFRKLISCYQDMADIIPLACPGLMDFVERGDLDGEDLRKYLVELFYEFKDTPIDATVLGCTHYPFVKEMIQTVLGEDVLIFDGGRGTAKEMKRRLEEAGLRNLQEEKGAVQFENSLNVATKIQMCNKLLRK